jgi:hypothetical protein
MIRLYRDSRVIKNIRHQSGFILSMEAVLLFTILGIGLLFGVSLLRNSLIKYYFNQVNTRFFVADSHASPILIGDVVGFDEHETPLVVFTDYNSATNMLPGSFNYRTLIGIRDDRFTTRQPLLYSDTSCGVPACIAARSSELANGLIASAAKSSGTISYLNAMQGTNAPTYAVGRKLSEFSDKDFLYRSTGNACGVSLQSMWVSQTVGDNSQSCVAVSLSGSDLDNFKSVESVQMPDGLNNVLVNLTFPNLINMVENPLVDFSYTTPTGESP